MTAAGRAMTDEISEAYIEVVNLARAIGVTRIDLMEGCWEHQIDDQWWIAMNGHKKPTKCSAGATVPPFEMYVQFNGWPAGVVAPNGGIIAAGELANEDTFIAAVKAAAGGSL
jgi:hypothetical protein